MIVSTSVAPDLLSAGSSDPSFANVSLLLHFEGADASTTFTDSSSNGFSPTVDGDAQIDTAQFKYGSSSGLFDGTGDDLDYGDDDAFDFGTGDFTIECWVRPNSLATRAIMTKRPGSFGAGDWEFVITSDGKLRFRGNTLGNLDSASSTVSTGSWQHVAVTRSGSSIDVWHEGTSVASGTSAEDFSTANVLRVGSGHNAQYWDGWIDELRITKGVARYTGSFTPEGPFPDS